MAGLEAGSKTSSHHWQICVGCWRGEGVRLTPHCLWSGEWWERGMQGDPGMEGRTPCRDVPWALRWLQFTLIHLMFKCKTCYAIMSGWVFLLF